MDTNDHSTPAASVTDPMDTIANMLLGEEPGEEDAQADPTQEQTPETDDTEELNDAEELSEDSTEGDDEVEESEAEESEGDEDDESLAAMLGVDESQIAMNEDGSFKLNVKIDGEQGQVSLAEAIKNYQTEGSVTNKSKALANERKEFETAVATKALEIKESLQRNQQLTQVLEQELLADYEKVEWDDLRQYDPAEWSAKRQEYAAKYQRIQRVKGELNEQQTEAQQAEQEQTNVKQREYVQKQWDAMIANNPTWGDKATYEKDMGGIRDFAGKVYGFTEADFTTVVDPRIIEMAKDAQAYRQGKKVAEKKLKPVPKVQKRGGVRKAPKVSKLDKLTKAAKTARGSNKRKAQTDAVAELLLGG